jgi:hypothetical protein
MGALAASGELGEVEPYIPAPRLAIRGLGVPEATFAEETVVTGVPAETADTMVNVLEEEVEGAGRP